MAKTGRSRCTGVERDARGKIARGVYCMGSLALGLITPAHPSVAETAVATIWRDFVVPGVLASGPWAPQKDDIRTWATAMETRTGTGYQGVLGNTLAIASGGGGYAVGDTITLACAGATFATANYPSGAPVVAVTRVSSGAVTGVTLTNIGLATATPVGGTCTFTQSATSGSGAGASFAGGFGPIAAGISFQDLTSGGGGPYNGNNILGTGTPNVKLAGPENVALGDYALGALIGASAQNTALGHNACGTGAGTTFVASYLVCIGNDAGRDIASGVARTVTIGTVAGQKAAGGDNVYVGHAAGNAHTGTGALAIGSSTAPVNTTGTYWDAIGYRAGQNSTTASFFVGIGTFALSALTTGGYNVGIGAYACPALTTGQNNVCIGPSVAQTNLVTNSNSIVIGNNLVDVPAGWTGAFLNIGNALYGDLEKFHFTMGPSSGYAPTLSGCGTGATIGQYSNDMDGQVTIGTSAGTICTVTFKNAYSHHNNCIVQIRATGPTWSYGYSTSLINITASSAWASGTSFDYHCSGY